ncbi:MAG: family 16 glycosylhydrolase, partial [Planctomycetota bacterium]
PDGRTYDITGPIAFAPGPDASDLVRSGSPLDAREHRMRVHFSGGPVAIEELSFSLRVPHALTPATLVQNTDGDAWTLVWSDEFDVDGHPDESKWTSDVGDWGWGNKEPQEYTHGRLANARCEDGLLHITAVKDDAGHWTSARLTTRGKQSFLYGKIDIRAKVPVGDGAWAAGWLLGDAYRDEVSWPYCGEIDVMEAVGREIDDETGDGINHGSCHTRAYYFKQGNHISSTLDVESMGAFHTYTVEWTPDAVKMLVDGHHYYTYDKTANELEWPFAKPQNVILNLAMGGGMGQAIDPSLVSQEVVVDHVRVYGRR